MNLFRRASPSPRPARRGAQKQAWLALLLSLYAGLSDFQLLAQNLLISEFLAANSANQADEDGEFSDWVEIHNPESSPAALDGWYLTDSPDDLNRWRFPAVTLPPQGFLRVFASGKNRVDPARELHTNFRLERDGGYLALVRPDGTSVASAFSPAYPRQLSDVSYGRSMRSATEILLPADAPGRLWIPTDDRWGRAWQQAEFDDSSWRAVTSNVGYDRPEAGSPEPVEPPLLPSDVTQPDAFIVPTSVNSPENEDVLKAIDNNPQTKYLNFDKLNAGFTVTPGAENTVVTGLRLTSANDAPERDPASYLLLGSNDGAAFEEIARGAVPVFSGRFVPVQLTFSNTKSYRHYRLLFPTVRNASAAVAVQIAEVELLGLSGPAPAAFPEWIRTDIEGDLYARSASAYLRVPFNVAQIPASGGLSLKIRHEDGFVAYLNGREVARANAPAAVAFNSAALTNRLRGEAVVEQEFRLGSAASWIRLGANVLALHGLNSQADSRDFLLNVQLENTALILGEMGYLEPPTPGAANAVAAGGLVADVTFDRPHGFLSSPIAVTLACPTPGATLRYTTNGSVPSLTNGVLYTAAIPVAHTALLRAAAFREGWRPSRVVTRTFLFLEDVAAQSQANAVAAGFPSRWSGQAADYGLDPRVVASGGKDNYGGKYARTLQADLQTLPTLSLVMDTADLFGPQGIYAHPESRGSAWERAVSVELIHPDGTPGFQQNAGVRIQGGAFRRFDLTLKKSFRLVFREKYGATALEYPLFGPAASDRLDNIVLRANSNDAWPYGGDSAVYVRDAFAMETARAMGMIVPHTTFVHLYINGLYWGLYNPVERPDAGFSSTYRGGNREDWDSINQDSAPDGNYDAWNRLMSQLNQDLTSTAAFQKLQGNFSNGARNPAYEDLLDVENMIDYMILNFYVGNTDWPGRNWWAGRDRANGDGFHFYPWDTETALGFSGLNVDVTGADSAVARPYAACRVNAAFRLWFADRVHRHFFNGGPLYVNPTRPAWDPSHPADNPSAARFAALAAVVSRGIVGESARWGDQLRPTPFTRDENWQTARDGLLREFFPQRSALVLEQFRRAGLYPRTAAPVMNQHGGAAPVGFQLTLTAPQGTIFYTTNGSDPRLPGAPRYGGPVTLSDLTTVKARVQNGAEWSALEEANFVVGSPELVLSELNYHPADPSPAEQAAGFSDDDDFEYLELANRGNATANLEDLRFVTGIEFAFAGSAVTRLAPGAQVLVVRNQAAFEKRYGLGKPVAGEYAGRLDNSGERVELVDASGRLVLGFTYGTRAPWPELADGSGPSLEVIQPGSNLDLPSNWRASIGAGGSPGLPNPGPPFRVEWIGDGATSLRLRFPGRAGSGYTVYTRNSLDSGDWQIVLHGAPLPADQEVEVTVDSATGEDARFLEVSIP